MPRHHSLGGKNRIDERIRRALTESKKRLFGIYKLNIKRSDIPAMTHVDYSARIQMLSWCERNQVDYVVGIAKNDRLERLTADSMKEARQFFYQYGRKVRWFTEFIYGARTWNRKRRVNAKVEYSARGGNPRYIVTNLEGKAKYLYDKLYCARGDMENRIKEQQLDLYADRTSYHRWWPNQFRLHRRGNHPQHSSHPVHDVEQSSLPVLVLPGRRSTGAGISQRTYKISAGFSKSTGDFVQKLKIPSPETGHPLKSSSSLAFKTRNLNSNSSSHQKTEKWHLKGVTHATCRLVSPK